MPVRNPVKKGLRLSFFNNKGTAEKPRYARKQGVDAGVVLPIRRQGNDAVNAAEGGFSAVPKDYDVLITPTRKTLWGLIDKKACIIGGGGSHRLNLADAILVKDNHIDLVNRDFGLLLQRIFESKVDTRFIEIEVRNLQDVLACAKAFYAFLGQRLRTVGALLMDNMTAGEVGEAMKELKKAKLDDNLLFEASGGIIEKNVIDYAKTGVDIISMGCLTMETRTIDMSLKVAI